MIKLGFNNVALYPNSGIQIQIAGGELIFEGNCSIGNNSVIAVGKKGKLIFGNNFSATSSAKFACQHLIQFEDEVLCGWESMFVDSDFHATTNIETGEKSKGYGSIHIGAECWFGFKTIITKNVDLPEKCIVSANSMLCSTKGVQPMSLLAGVPAKVKKSGLWRNPKDDIINYK